MSSEPTFAQVQRRATLDREERRALGIKRPIVEVKEGWIEAVLDPRWILAFRVTKDDRNLPVLGEVRVFPKGKRPTSWAGRWVAEVEGSVAQSPRGGITARLLRRIHTGPAEAMLATVSRLFSRDARTWKQIYGNPLPPYLEDDPAPLLIARESAQTDRPATSGRGRRREPDATYAKVAEAYVAACGRRSRMPISDTARRFRMTNTKVRMMIHTARQRGLLTGGQQGKAGGELTKQAMAMLNEKSRPVRRRKRR